MALGFRALGFRDAYFKTSRAPPHCTLKPPNRAASQARGAKVLPKTAPVCRIRSDRIPLARVPKLE